VTCFKDPYFQGTEHHYSCLVLVSFSEFQLSLSYWVVLNCIYCFAENVV